jgi:hypothetical protein
MVVSTRIRLAGFGVLAVAAVVVTFAVGSGVRSTQPVRVTATGGSTRAAVVKALADYDTNERAASSAPQQSVVGGWVARDLLTAVARADADALDVQRQVANRPTEPPSPDRRIPILIAIAVLAICWLGLTTRSSGTPWLLPETSFVKGNPSSNVHPGRLS